METRNTKFHLLWATQKCQNLVLFWRFENVILISIILTFIVAQNIHCSQFTVSTFMTYFIGYIMIWFLIYFGTHKYELRSFLMGSPQYINISFNDNKYSKGCLIKKRAAQCMKLPLYAWSREGSDPLEISVCRLFL
jgi:hypothetical protein